MYSSRMLVWSAVLSLAFAGAALPASAQVLSHFDVSGGYQLIRVEGETFGAGWYAEFADNLNETFGIVFFQVGGNYKSINDVDFKAHSFMGGARISSRSNPQVVPFGQVLVGAVHGSASSDFLGLLGNIKLFDETDFGLQVGGGVNIMPASNIGVRLGADYLRVFSDPGGNVFRFVAGVVIPIGQRRLGP